MIVYFMRMLSDYLLDRLTRPDKLGTRVDSMPAGGERGGISENRHNSLK